MAALRKYLRLGAAFLLAKQAVGEDAGSADGEEGTCSAKNIGACSQEQQENLNVTQQLVEEGNALAGKEDYEGALKLYTLALRVDNTSEWSANPYINAGLALKAMDRRAEGIEFMKAGVKLNPKLFHGQYNLGNTLSEDKIWGEADAAYTAALPLATPENRMHVLIGHCRLLLRLYHYEEGRAALAGRDILAELGELGVQLSAVVKSREKPETDLVSLVSNIFTLTGRKEGGSWSEWAVKKGIWKTVNQRPSHMDLSFATSYKATPWWKAGGSHELPDFLEEISDSWKKLQKEYDSLVKKGKLVAPDDDGSTDFQWYDKSKGHDWRQLELFTAGAKNFENAKVAKTAARLFGETQVKGDDQSRVFYSVMAPGTRTIPRCGVSNTRITCYMGLRIPNVDTEKHGISVAGEARSMKQGAWACFDDSFEHTIYNEADEPSGTVVVQFRHPALPKQANR